jgi:hypothetical protein
MMALLVCMPGALARPEPEPRGTSPASARARSATAQPGHLRTARQDGGEDSVGVEVTDGDGRRLGGPRFGGQRPDCLGFPGAARQGPLRGAHNARLGTAFLALASTRLALGPAAP